MSSYATSQISFIVPVISLASKTALVCSIPPLPHTLFNRYDFITSRYFQVTCHYSFQCRFNAVFNPLLGRPSRQRKGAASYESSMFMQRPISSDFIPTDLFPPHLQKFGHFFCPEGLAHHERLLIFEPFAHQCSHWLVLRRNHRISSAPWRSSSLTKTT